MPAWPTMCEFESIWWSLVAVGGGRENHDVAPCSVKKVIKIACVNDMEDGRSVEALMHPGHVRRPYRSFQRAPTPGE